MATLKGLSGKTYQTANTHFAGKGEGLIYDVIGSPTEVAKIFHADKRTTERERKLSAMVNHTPGVMEQYAWPVDVLYENGKFVGYIMPKVTGKSNLRDIYVYDNRKGRPWSLYVAIAKNLASAIYHVHEMGQVIGDLNPDNILVNPNDGLVTLIDTDSYHITDNANKVYRCEVGVAEFIAPELQGKHFASAPLPTFTQETDLFSLSVLVFSLLMNGAHPFACKVISGSVSQFQQIDNISSGVCAYFSASTRATIDIPKYAPALESLPQDLQNLFKRAFVDGHKNGNLRPSAEEFYHALESLAENNIQQCTANPEHLYYQRAANCPWCEVAAKMKVVGQSAFNASTISSSGSGSGQQAPVRPSQQAFTPSTPTFQPAPQPSFMSKILQYKKQLGIAAIAVVVLIIGFNIFGNNSPSDPNAAQVGNFANSGNESNNSGGTSNNSNNNRTNTPAPTADTALENSNRAYQAGVQAMTNRNYSQAITEFRKVIDRDADYNNAQTRLTEAIQSYKDDLFASFTTLEASGSFSDIITRLNTANTLLPADNDITSRITQYTTLMHERDREFVLGRISEINETATSPHGYDEGITALRALATQYPAMNTEINAEITRFTSELLNTVEINLNTSSLALSNGSSTNLSIITNPANIRNLDFTWQSSNTTVATVNNNGQVTARGFGSTEIRVLTTDGVVRASCTVGISASLGNEIKMYQSSRAMEYPAQGSFRMAGVSYTNGVALNSGYSGSYALYNIDGQYSTLSGLYGPVDGTGNNRTIGIYGDDRLLIELHSNAGALPRSFSIDVTGVNQIKIALSGSAASGNPYHAVANVVLSNDPVTVIADNPTNVVNSAGSATLGEEIKAYQTSRANEYPAQGSFRMAGVNYINGVILNSGYSGSYALYNIAGQYTVMSGLYGPVDGTGNNRNILIYGDGRLLIELQSNAKAMPQSFSIDITGVNQIRVELSGSAASGNPYHALANVIFANSPVTVSPDNLNIGAYNDNSYLGSDIRAYQTSRVNEYPSQGTFRIAGVSYSSGITLNSGYSGSYALYNIAGHYTTLSGIYGPVDGTGNNRTINIYGDGRLLVALQSNSGAMPQTFSVNVTGVKQISIELSGNAASGNPYHALADVLLTK